MQIRSNTTGMEADVAVATDVDARDHCVVVIKGTFVAGPDGALTLADVQEPLARADEHHGDPQSTAVRRESEFALCKRKVDIVLDGMAVAPEGKPVPELSVALEIEGRRKVAVAVGERRWVRAAGELVPSRPVPFTQMPLTFDRAFGGIDDSEPGATGAELRNLVGVGYHPKRPAAQVEGLPLPNLERPDDRVSSPRRRVEPIGFGYVGRASAPRRDLGGTYDAQWLDEVAPFLPADFDPLYFQGAPLDQQIAPLRGGETVRCVNMSADRVVEYRLVADPIPVTFRFVQGPVKVQARPDTVILSPHRREACIVWRGSTPLGKKLHDLHAVDVGSPPDHGIRGYRDGRPIFAGLGAAVRWLSQPRPQPEVDPKTQEDG